MKLSQKGWTYAGHRGGGCILQVENRGRGDVT